VTAAASLAAQPIAASVLAHWHLCERRRPTLQGRAVAGPTDVHANDAPAKRFEQKLTISRIVAQIGQDRAMWFNCWPILK